MRSCERHHLRAERSRRAAVATLAQSTGTAERNIDLAVSKHHFDTEAEAENFAVMTAREWIYQNTPSEHSDGR